MNRHSGSKPQRAVGRHRPGQDNPLLPLEPCQRAADPHRQRAQLHQRQSARWQSARRWMPTVPACHTQSATRLATASKLAVKSAANSSVQSPDSGAGEISAGEGSNTELVSDQSCPVAGIRSPSGIRTVAPPRWPRVRITSSASPTTSTCIHTMLFAALRWPDDIASTTVDFAPLTITHAACARPSTWVSMK